MLDEAFVKGRLRATRHLAFQGLRAGRGANGRRAEGRRREQEEREEPRDNARGEGSRVGRGRSERRKYVEVRAK